MSSFLDRVDIEAFDSHMNISLSQLYDSLLRNEDIKCGLLLEYRKEYL